VPSSQQRGELAEGGICRWLLWGCLGVAGSSKTGRSSLTGRELQHSAELLVQVMNRMTECLSKPQGWGSLRYSFVRMDG
jgi:hypothetical protein